ncbi:MAG: hypothetical protein ABJF89_05475 [Parasphingorhabdus sp.]|uniref:hypothetical protein n=3 Tax=Parasphingorhabdus sp. TaxID=2709688 RepID=UPI0032662FD0
MSARPKLVEIDVDPTEQDMDRFKKPAIAIAGGIAASLVIATLPHVYLENVVGATGLSELVSAAAPPLGNTARGLIAVVAGLISASTLYIFLNHKLKFLGGGSDMSLAIRKNLTPEPIEPERESKLRFAVPKLNLSAKSLTKFLKKPKKSAGEVTELKDLPEVRPADSHPDAPARQPIFAASDLGTPLDGKIQQFDQPEAEPEMAEAVERPEPTIAQPAPFVGEKVFAASPEADVAPAAVQAPISTEQADLSTLSLAELTDRLETGLKRLEALEMLKRNVEPQVTQQAAPIVEEPAPQAEVPEMAAPVAMPPLRSVASVEADVQDNRQADMDAALKAALGTLERMTAHR